MTDAADNSHTRQDEPFDSALGSDLGNEQTQIISERVAERVKWDACYSQYTVSDDATSRVSDEALAEQLARLLPDGARVLEVGCGAGGQSLALARLRRFDINLMDFSEPAMKCAEAAFHRENMTARFIRDDAFALRPPEYDLVFNAGSLEHYSPEQQVAFLRGMASRSRRYVLVLVPNNRCYWYWIWRVHHASRGQWQYGKETPLSDLSGLFHAVGLTLLGEAFLGEIWTEKFITSLPDMGERLRGEILTVHRSPIVLPEQKAYLYAALGSVEPTAELPAGTVFHYGARKTTGGEPQWQAAQADLLAARQDGERLREEVLPAWQEDCRRLEERNRGLKAELDALRASRMVQGVTLINRTLGRLRDTLNAKGVAGWVKSCARMPGDRWRLRANLRRAMDDGTHRPVVLYPPLIDWDMPLVQRPHHVALGLAREGFVYCHMQPEHLGFRVVWRQPAQDLPCFVTSFHRDVRRILDAWKGPKIVLYYATDLSLTREKLRHDMAAGYLLCLEYVDDVSPDVQGIASTEMLDALDFAFRTPEIAVVCTATRLYERASRYRIENVRLVTNGVEYEHFATPVPEARVPAEMRRILSRGGPVIGYFGAIAKWMDVELLKRIVTSRPHFQVVLIGLDYDRSLEQWGLHRFDNLHVLPPVAYTDLPGYASRFDVSIIPFLINDVTKATSPIKLFEYMALGHPIVTTAMPECLKYKSVLIGHTHEEFLRRLDEALSLRKDPIYGALLREEALANTWAAKAGAIADLLRENLLRVSGGSLPRRVEFSQP